ncbi:MAG: PQQ-binding-like beta-propeller repeat protein [Vicinamibacterales bacterium]|jgi:alcohol dehydrogenase (cytochrome c)|nr:PQQ-binding-like beta-propeller repeat protein [Vicinamibacterales bacterium]
MRTRLTLAVLMCATFVMTAAVPAKAQAPDITPVTDAALQNPDPEDWLSWRRTLDGWGYSPLDQIDTDNVGNLRLAWSWGLEAGVSQTTPIVRDGVMFVANPGNVVHALDARTGDLLWEYRYEMDERRRTAAQMRSLAIYQDLILLNTVDAHMVAIDARTGEERWNTPVGSAPGYTFSSGPIVADGTVVTGLTGCGRYREDTCYVVGLDGRTGRELWRTSTVALPGERGGDSWGDLPVLFRAGSDAWIPGSYDPSTGLLFWGTAQAKPWSRDARGTDGDALYTNSTLALNPTTGELEWYFQHIPGDSHDMDETFERILIDYDGKQSVFSMGKSAILWENDRETGQFVRASDLGYQNLFDIDPQTGQAMYKDGMVQEVGEVVNFCPSTGGFKSLRAMAYHPDTEALYVPLNLNCETAAFLPVEKRDGGGGAGGVRDRAYHFHPDSPDNIGELQALDIRTGETKWRQRRRTPYNTAALTTGGGLVFVGDWERYVFAYDVESGAELWQTRLPHMTNGFPITYAVDGTQYVAIGTGQSIGGSSWATIIPAELLPEKKNPRTSGGIFVFALP